MCHSHKVSYGLSKYDIFNIHYHEFSSSFSSYSVALEWELVHKIADFVRILNHKQGIGQGMS